MTRFSSAAIILVSALFLFQLRYYYSVPKQAYRESLEFIEANRDPDEIVIAIHLIETGFRYYSQSYVIEEGTDYFYLRSLDALDEVLSNNEGKRAILVTTFPRALHIALPDLNARISRDWQVVQTFPGSVGDGTISIWEPRNP